MIEAKEIRKGIWIMIEGQAIQLDEDDIEVIFATRNWSSLIPIPITSHLLEACGFEFDEMASRYFFQPDMENWEYRIKEVPGGWLFSQGFFDVNSEICTVNYLHQLQNAFYVVSALELTYSPNTK